MLLCTFIRLWKCEWLSTQRNVYNWKTWFERELLECDSFCKLLCFLWHLFLHYYLFFPHDFSPSPQLTNESHIYKKKSTWTWTFWQKRIFFSSWEHSCLTLCPCNHWSIWTVLSSLFSSLNHYTLQSALPFSWMWDSRHSPGVR